jgi:cytochrome c556
MKLFLVMLFTAFAVFAATPQSGEDFSAAMKKVIPTNGSLGKNVTAKDAEAVKKDAAALEAIFKTSEDFWKARKVQDAIDWSIQAKNGAAEVGKLAAAGEWEKIPDVRKKIQETCMACHTAHREKLEGGGYKIK